MKLLCFRKDKEDGFFCSLETRKEEDNVTVVLYSKRGEENEAVVSEWVSFPR
jgi:hypothetical protein